MQPSLVLFTTVPIKNNHKKIDKISNKHYNVKFTF